MEPNNEIILYQSEDGKIRIDVQLKNDTVWLNQYQLAELFQTDRTSIVKHIKNIYVSGELSENSTCAKFAQVQKEGNRDISRNIIYYNLDLIISVGYRVQSHIATRFRIWATQCLKEYIVKGFALDDERMKAAGNLRYFDELVERIRDIRSSERIFYQKVKDIFALSIDYEPKTDISREFFATIQNKLHGLSISIPQLKRAWRACLKRRCKYVPYFGTSALRYFDFAQCDGSSILLYPSFATRGIMKSLH
jgi:hypothetical protein